jgi:hypothetical protein
MVGRGVVHGRLSAGAACLRRAFALIGEWSGHGIVNLVQQVSGPVRQNLGCFANQRAKDSVILLEC